MTELVLPTARDFVTPSPFTLRPEQDLFDAIDLLVEHQATAAPVVDEDGRLLGMLTEKDCLRVLAALTYQDQADGGTVADFQSQIRVVCERDMDIFRVAEQFLGTNFPMLPVVGDGKLEGLISRQALLQGVQRFQRQWHVLRGQEERLAGHQADRPRSIQALQTTAARQSRDQLVRLLGRKH